jgi:hypothetical protein
MWVAIIASVIRPVVLVVVPSVVVPSVVAPIRITIVAAISIATISVAGITVVATIPVTITAVLRHIAICATLRIRRWSERRRHRERENAHQRQ